MTYFVSLLRPKCVLRYQRILLFLGTKADTARAIIIHPCRRTQLVGPDLASEQVLAAEADAGARGAGTEEPGEDLAAAEESQLNSWVAL